MVSGKFGCKKVYVGSIIAMTESIETILEPKNDNAVVLR